MVLNTAVLPKNELIQFCQKLIQTPSVNGVDCEKSIVLVIEEYAKKWGLETQILGLDQNRPCLLVSTNLNSQSDLMLIAHTDTVPVGNELEWKYPPFSGTIENNKIYGRGAIDNKGGLVAAMAAIILLKLNKIEISNPPLLVCVPDEESGATGILGIKYLDKLGKLSGKGVIYTYPGTSVLHIGHRGVFRIKIKSIGKSFHTGTSEWQNTGGSYNAINGLADLLLKLEGLNFERENKKKFFETYKTVITPTIISGGTGISISPDYAEAFIDIRVIPSFPKEKIEALIQDIINDIKKTRANLSIEYEIITYIPPTIIDENSYVVQSLIKATEEVLHITPKVSVSGPANESYILNDLGFPTCILGPNGEGVHACDEYVLTESIFQVAHIYAKTVISLSQ